MRASRSPETGDGVVWSAGPKVVFATRHVPQQPWHVPLASRTAAAVGVTAKPTTASWPDIGAGPGCSAEAPCSCLIVFLQLPRSINDINCVSPMPGTWCLMGTGASPSTSSGTSFRWCICDHLVGSHFLKIAGPSVSSVRSFSAATITPPARPNQTFCLTRRDTHFDLLPHRSRVADGQSQEDSFEKKEAQPRTSERAERAVGNAFPWYWDATM